MEKSQNWPIKNWRNRNNIDSHFEYIILAVKTVLQTQFQNWPKMAKNENL